MASYVKFNSWVDKLSGKIIDVVGTAGSTSDTCNVGLTNSAPSASANTVWSDITEITAHNGYSAGGASTANVGSTTTGTFTLTGTNVTWTASGGTIGPFRYIVVYDVTAASSPLIAYWDYGSNLTLADGDSFTVKFNNGVSSGAIYTLA